MRSASAFIEWDRGSACITAETTPDGVTMQRLTGPLAPHVGAALASGAESPASECVSGMRVMMAAS
jgi:hypothetical protein